jgi:hypothetical protein
MSKKRSSPNSATRSKLSHASSAEFIRPNRCDSTGSK